jgi:hypothetical protein
MKTQQVSRGSIFLWNEMSKITQIVNNERKYVSLWPRVSPIFLNKFTTFMRIVRENYLEAYSPQYLFLYGEVGGLAGIYGTYNRGVLYFIELPLLLWGLFRLHRFVKKPVVYFLLGGFLFSGLPSAFVIDKSYAARSIMMIPFLAIFIGVGIVDVCIYINKKRRVLRCICIALVVLCYGYSIANYGFHYFSRYPVYGAESWFVSSRDLYNYIEKAIGEGKSIVIANPGDLLIQFAFYGKFDPKLVRDFYAKDTPKKLGNILFLNGCIDTHGEMLVMADHFKEKTIYITKPECHKEATTTAYIRDRGEYLHVLWKIFESK